MQYEPPHAARIYRYLVQQAEADDGADTETRWSWLIAAHIVGQHHLPLHGDSHVRMLRLAWATRDPAEAAGQLLRLALVPIGHMLGRLPEGNIGRATVNAFRPMPVDERSRALIERADRHASPASQPQDPRAHCPRT